MAIVNNGILDGFSGKVGTVVGATINGVSILRAKPRRKRNRRSTPGQELVKAKFSMALRFLKSMHSLLLISMEGKKGIDGYRSAFNPIVNEAIGGNYPDLVMDYSKIIIAKGDLPNGSSPKAELVDGGIQFTWGNSETKNAKASDKAIVVAYAPKYNFTDYTMNALRNDGSITLPVDGEPGEEFHTWIAFISEDGKRLSHSKYLGKLTLS